MAGSHDDGISQASSVPRRLWFLGIAGLLAYAVLAGLSFAFHPDNPHPPLLASLTVLALATLCYWFALGCVFRRGQEENACWLRVVLGFSVAYRLLLLPSVPIQEIDFYRYLWDGRVTLHGFNPYHFSPFQVEDSGPLATPSSEIAALWQLGRQSASVQAIFESVHHRGVPTVYPPAAQLVFAVGALVPATAPVWVHVLVLKTILVGFDVATLFLLVTLL